MTPAPLTTYTTKLTTKQGHVLHDILKKKGCDFRTVPHTHFAATDRDYNVAFYTSGKLVVQGRGTRDFVEFVLEPEVLQEAKLGYEEILNPDLLVPRFGIDESGKGDFFGPLCVAGVYVNESVIHIWKDRGIRDSKAIGSDRKIHDLAKLIRETEGCVHSIVRIGNEAYNRLYKKMGSVNSVLAWGHARAIENLMLQRHRMVPAPVRAISDQFASTKDTVARAMLSLGREIELVQRHKAESDIAVAAASILARDEFVTHLAKAGQSLGVVLPKGASPEVEKVGREIVAKFGADALSKVGKMHFRTSYRILGLPEPPKTEWKKR